jgi:hypothetical protein
VGQNEESILILLGLVVGLAMLPGAVAGTAIGWYRGQLGAGLGCGTVGGMFGGAIGFVLYVDYRKSLPFVDRGSSDFVGCLCVFGGNLIVAILLAAVFTWRPTAPTSKDGSEVLDEPRN